MGRFGEACSSGADRPADCVWNGRPDVVSGVTVERLRAARPMGPSRVALDGWICVRSADSGFYTRSAAKHETGIVKPYVVVVNRRHRVVRLNIRFDQSHG